jgi:hypothetical protein
MAYDVSPTGATPGETCTRWYRWRALLQRGLFNVRQRPLLVKKFRFRPIETEHQFELAGEIGGDPVRLLTGGSSCADVEIDRTVGVHAQLLSDWTESIGLDQFVGLAPTCMGPNPRVVVSY